MNVSPGEVYDLYKEGLSISEIARRLKISRTWVNIKLREYNLDKREFELDNRKRELDIEEADLEARRKEIDKIPELEEKTHSLKSEVDSLTKERDDLEKEARSNREVVEEIKAFKERREEAANLLSELSNRIELHKKSLKKLEGIEKQIERKTISLRSIEYKCDKNRKINMKLVDENFHLQEEIKLKNEDIKLKNKAIHEIEQSYYGYLELTKQIDLFMHGGSDMKTKTHEEIRTKVLRGMELIAEDAKITKPDSKSESELQALLRDPTILKRFFSRTVSHKKFKE